MEPYFNRETILENLFQEEKLESSWLDRNLGIQNSKIYSTAELSKRYFKTLKTEKGETVFKVPKLIYILYAALVLALIGALIMAIINAHSSDGFNPAIGLIPGIIILIVIIALGDIKDENQNFKIVLSHEGMTIRDIPYNWDEILDTFVIIRRKGRTTSYFLIVALNVGTTDRWDITNLLSLSSDGKLSAYIEYYKKIA
mgnify:CR=1 FL=1